jgi:hypothetical protein
MTGGTTICLHPLTIPIFMIAWINFVIISAPNALRRSLDPAIQSPNPRLFGINENAVVLCSIVENRR